MTHRLEILLCLWIFLVLPAAYLAACQLHGFDPAMCETHQACEWRHA